MRSFERGLAVFCALAGVVMLFVAGSLYFVNGQVSSQVSYTLIAGIALLVGYGILDPTALGSLVRSRQARFGSMSVIVTAVVLGLLVMVNILASRSTAAVDLTKAQYYTLSPKSVLVTSKLDSDLTVIGFFRPGEAGSRQQVDTLLGLYRGVNPHVKVIYIDPDKQPERATQLGVTISGSLALQYKDRAPVVLTLASESESDVTAAILRLESSRTPTICWGVGDGERDLTSTDSVSGYQQAADALRGSNYQLRDLVVSQQTAIPITGCDIVAIAGVQHAISGAGIKAVQDYVAAGGRLLLAVDPWPLDPRSLDTANQLIAGTWVRFSGGVVIEGDAGHAANNDPTAPVVYSYGRSPITRDLTNRVTVFPQSTAIVGSAGSGYTSTDLAVTTSSSWQAVQPRDHPENRAAADLPGPFTILTTLSTPASGREARIILAGTSALAENRVLASGSSNQQLLLGSVDWLSGQEDLIAISPKPAASQQLQLTQQQANLNTFITLILIPGLIAAAGVMVFLRRRRTPTPA